MKKLSLFLIISKLAFAQTISFEEALNQTIENSKDLKKQKINIDVIHSQKRASCVFQQCNRLHRNRNFSAFERTVFMGNSRAV